MSHKHAVKEIIGECLSNQLDTRLTEALFSHLKDEHALKSSGFNCINDLMYSLKDNESKVLETLFFYRVNDMDEFNQEATKVVKDYKLGKLDPNNKRQ
jgi:ribonuclease D